MNYESVNAQGVLDPEAGVLVTKVATHGRSVAARAYFKRLELAGLIKPEAVKPLKVNKPEKDVTND